MWKETNSECKDAHFKFTKSGHNNPDFFSHCDVQMDVHHLRLHLQENPQLIDTVLAKLPDGAIIDSTTTIPAIESTPSDLSSESVTPAKRKKKDTIELMEFAHNMFKSEEVKGNELEKAQCESLRKEDQRKDLDSQRKEHQAKLQEHSDLLEWIEQLHNRLMSFPSDGNQKHKRMLSDTHRAGHWTEEESLWQLHVFLKMSSFS